MMRFNRGDAEALRDIYALYKDDLVSRGDGRSSAVCKQMYANISRAGLHRPAFYFGWMPNAASRRWTRSMGRPITLVKEPSIRWTKVSPVSWMP